MVDGEYRSDDNFYGDIRKEQEGISTQAKDLSKDLDATINDLSTVSFDLLTTPEKKAQARVKGERDLEDDLNTQRAWRHEYLDLTYISLLQEDALPLDLAGISLTRDALQRNNFTPEELQSIDELGSKLTQKYDRDAYVLFCQSIDFFDWLPRKLWSVLMVFSRLDEIDDSWKHILAQKLEAIEVDKFSHRNVLQLPEEVVEISKDLLARGCDDAAFADLVVKMNEEWQSYSLKREKRTFEPYTNKYVMTLCELLPWSQEQIEELQNAGTHIPDPLFVEQLEKHMYDALHGNELWKMSSSLFRGDILQKMIISMLISGVNMEDIDRPSGWLREQVVTGLKTLPEQVDYAALRLFFGEMPNLGEVSWSQDVSSFGETRDAIWHILYEYEQVNTVFAVGEKARERDELKKKVDAIVAFFQKLRDEIQAGRELEVSAIRSLVSDKHIAEIHGMKLGESDYDKYDFSGDEFAWFRKIKNEYFSDWIGKNNLTYKIVPNDEPLEEETKMKLGTYGFDPRDFDNHIEFAYDDYTIDGIKKLIFDLATLGFGKHIEIPISGFYMPRSIEYILNAMLHDIKKLDLQGSNFKNHKLFSEGEKIKKKVVYELLFEMMERGDTSFLRSGFWDSFSGDRLRLASPATYLPGTHQFWTTAAKYNYQDVSDAMLHPEGGNEFSYDRSTNTQRLTEDFTQEKLQFLKERFEVVNGEMGDTKEGRNIIKVLKKKGDDTYEKVIDLSNIGVPLRRKLGPRKIKESILPKRKNEDMMRFWEHEDAGKPFIHYLNQATDLSDEELVDWVEWLGKDFDFGMKYVSNQDNPIMSKDQIKVVWETTITQTIFHQAILKGRTGFLALLIENSKSKEIDIYETLHHTSEEFTRKIGPYDRKRKFRTRDEEENGRSLIHMIAECKEADKVDLMLDAIKGCANFQDISYLPGTKYKTKGEFNPEKYIGLLQEKNPQTGLTGLQTLAEHGHIEVVEELMKEYGLDLWGNKESAPLYKKIDTAKSIMHLIAGSKHASVETYKWYYKKWMKFEDRGGHNFMPVSDVWLRKTTLPEGDYLWHWHADRETDKRDDIVYNTAQKQYYLSHVVEYDQSEAPWKHTSIDVSLLPKDGYISKYVNIYLEKEERKALDDMGMSDYLHREKNVVPMDVLQLLMPDYQYYSPYLILDGKHIQEIVISGNPEKLQFLLHTARYDPSAEFDVDVRPYQEDGELRHLIIINGEGLIHKCLSYIDTPPDDIVQQGEEKTSERKLQMEKMIQLLREADQKHQGWYEKHIDYIDGTMMSRVKKILKK